MCGIAGIFAPAGLPPGKERELVAMRDAIVHRGPDDAGLWLDHDAGIGLAHRRLAIIDVSPAGHQPMASNSGRYVIVYNGEIYNFEELRTELERHRDVKWKGHSDTEVLLAAIEQWGIDATLARLRGMFAFALWDRSERVLTLARDPFGEKPLYYGWCGQGGRRELVFGSDLSAIRRCPGLDRAIDPSAVAALTTYGYIPEPISIYRDVRKLAPGTRISLSGPGQEDCATLAYWDLAREIEAASEDRVVAGEEAIEMVDQALGKSVARQLVADVPLGAFLSGGIDSSTIVSLMQRHSASAVKTFTIGYEDPAYDESASARAIARALGTEHNEWIVTPRDALEVIPRLSSIYAEPFADSSQIPTYLVSGFARHHVTVALSGDGGDELFGGYNRYLYTRRLWRTISHLPAPVRRVIGRGLSTLPAPAFNRFGQKVLGGNVRLLGDKIAKAAGVMSSADIDEVYRRLTSSGLADGENVVDSDGGGTPLGRRLITEIDPVRRMMALDMAGYLPGDILAKVDRASMAHSLESRVPMLDPDVVRLALRIDVDTLFADGKGKWPLRRLLGRDLDPKLFDSPKMGFGIPLDSWMRGPLREWCGDLVAYSAAALDGFVDADRTRRLWQEHLSGSVNRQHQLWPVLMLADWMRAEQADYATLRAASA